jgi:PAS domain S-box-containing protein
LSTVLPASVRVLGRWGALFAFLLAAAFAWVLWSDWHTRIAAGQRQALTLATGTERVLRSELMVSERALRGLAGDGKAYLQQDALAEQWWRAAIAAVLERNPTFASITLVDGAGQPLWAGEGDRDFARWAPAAAASSYRRLQIGQMERVAGRNYTLRTALQVAPERWLLARVDGDVVQGIVLNQDTGQLGVVSISTRSGQMLANSAKPELLGRYVDYPSLHLPPSATVHVRGAQVSPRDQIKRVSAVSALQEYPLVVFAGLAVDELLAPWWRYLVTAVALYGACLLGFCYLLLNVRKSALQQLRLAEDLRERHAEMLLAHQVGRVGTWWMETAGGDIHVSDMTREMLGLTENSASSETFLARVHVDDAANLRQTISQVWRGESGLSSMFRLVLSGGDTRWLAVRGERVGTGKHGQRLIGAVVDISDRIHTQAKAHEAERQLRLVFDRNPTPFWIFDLTTLRFLEVNRAAIQQYGFSREEFLSMTIMEIRPESEQAELWEMIGENRAGRTHDPKVRVHRRKDGSLLQARGHVALVDFNGVSACLVLAEDVSQRVAHEQELAYRATHHQGTGLLTVQALAERMDDGQDGYVVAYIQLSGMQMVGNALGRDAGDALLQAVIVRLAALGKRYGELAFQPGEDFVLVIADPQRRDEALNAVMTALTAPVQGRDSYHQLQVRVGVAVCPTDGELAEQVIGKAAQAAQAAREGDLRIAHFNNELAGRFAERMQLAGRIQNALENDEFQLHFQPIRHADDGSVAALEALLRWPQTDGSFIPPSAFIPLCEDTGLIVALGRWVIRAAARAHQQLVAEGWGDVSIAVNVSAVQFFSSDLVEEFGQVSREFSLRRGALQLELTESSLMRDPQQALQTMQRLHEQGVGVSLDDFGTGFSSMAYLQHLPLESLKIDRAFVCDVERNPRNAAICRALLSLAHSMGLVVIAEGVETEGQYAWLTAHGCDQVQGYLLGRPMPLAKLLDLLKLNPYRV